jgi:exodeoxyribonuclease X
MNETQTLHEALIVDTETSGISSADKMIEYAHLSLPALEQLQTVSPIYSYTDVAQLQSLWNPGVDIHPQASAVNGWTKERYAEHPPVEGFQMEATNYIIGHNVDFDCKFIGEPTAKRICTIRLAKLAWPKTTSGVTSYKLTNLIEHFLPNGKDLTKEAHGALADCYLTFILLDEILKRFPRVTSWEELYQLQATTAKAAPKKAATKLEVMPFGKYKNELFCDIPREYLRWALDNMDLKDNLREAMQGAYGRGVR